MFFIITHNAKCIQYEDDGKPKEIVVCLLIFLDAIFVHTIKMYFMQRNIHWQKTDQYRVSCKMDYHCHHLGGAVAQF